MALIDLEIHSVRNIEHAKIELGEGVNIVYGENGSGKTSLLEAISILGTGKSFRTSKIKRVIKSGCAELTVFGRVSKNHSIRTIGIKKNATGTEARLNGVEERNQSLLAKEFPVAVISPESHRLVEEGPSWKRRFLDWGLFHVEQSFHENWKNYKTALKNRNALLGDLTKRSVSDPLYRQLDQWDQTLCAYGETLTLLGRKYVQDISNTASEIFDQLLPNLHISLVYKQGWPASDESMEMAVKRCRQKDIKQGFTDIGPHRSDLVIRSGESDIRERVSRGQQKLVIYALCLAQAIDLKRRNNIDTTLLLDDLGAELDIVNARNLIELIERHFTQVLITSANLHALPSLTVKSAKVFHVEHGRIIH